MLIFSLLAAMLVCFGIPAAGFFLFKRRQKGCGKIFLAGMLAFFISQICIRIPILQSLLPGFAWFPLLQMQPWPYGLFLGFTAGLAEEGARWIAMKFFLKGRLEGKDGIIFGLGHGGIEGVLFLGLPAAAYLYMEFMGTGTLPPQNAGSILLGVYERLYVIAFHIGASLMIMYGIKKEQDGIFFLLALLSHTVMDAAIVILPAEFGTGILGLELFGTAVSAVTLGMGFFLHNKMTGGRK